MRAMSSLILHVLWLVPVVNAGSQAASQGLDDRLRVLQPLVGLRCVGILSDIEVSMRMESILNGKAIKRTSAATAIDYSDETIIYWDIERHELAFFEVTTRGHVARGTVTAKEGIVVFHGRLVMPERTSEFRNTYELMSDGTIKDDWHNLEGEEWVLGHSIDCVPER